MFVFLILFFPKSLTLILFRILLIGDSNIFHNANNIINDRWLQFWPIELHAKKGLRASDLENPELSLKAKSFSHVILCVGNNDLTPWREREALSAKNAASYIAAFVNVVSKSNVNVCVIGLTKRQDLKEFAGTGVAVECNDFLIEWVGRDRFVKPDIRPKHCKEDKCHYNEMGVNNLKAAILDVIVNKFEL